MKDEIMYVFDKNFKRLNNLIALYEDLRDHAVGRTSTYNLEILRSTVVLLHSTLEDYLRSLSKWKMITANKDVISQIPLNITTDINRNLKFSLGDLLPFSSMTVREIILSSIEKHLDKTSYNNSTDIATTLKNINLDVNARIQSHFGILDEMLLRRHHIVHQADREFKVGRGFHRVKSINLQRVIRWRNTVDKFVFEVNKQILDD